ATVAARVRGSDPDSPLVSHPPRTPTELCTESDHPTAPAAKDRCEPHRQSDARPETPNLPEAPGQPRCSVPRDQVVAMSTLVAMVRGQGKHRLGNSGRLCVKADRAHDERR